MIYLASPLYHQEKNIMDARAKVIDQYFAMLVRLGFEVFSPVTHFMPAHILNDRKEPGPNYYLGVDLKILESGIFDRAILLELPGCHDSKGVEQEIKTIERINEEVPESIQFYRAKLVKLWDGRVTLQVPCYNCKDMQGYTREGADILGEGGEIVGCPRCSDSHLCEPGQDWELSLVEPREQDRIIIPSILLEV